MTEDKDLERADENILLFVRAAVDAVFQLSNVDGIHNQSMESAQRRKKQRKKAIYKFHQANSAMGDIKNALDVLLREERKRLLNDPRIKELREAARHWSACDMPPEIEHRCGGCAKGRKSFEDFESLLKENE